MRIRVSHESTYRYDAPVSGVIQTLRLTPRNHDGQYVVFWRIDISADCRLDSHEDAFGNITHTFTAEGAFTELGVTVDGEVETQDTHGIVLGAIERFPPSLFLRDTALTHPDTAILAFAREARAAAGEDTLKLLHLMTERLHREIVFDPDPTHTATTAAEAFALRRGVCQDLSHVFIGAARSLGIPARYVGGYFHRADGVVRQEACHAWAEAFVADIGWVGFDPANGISPTDAHVRGAAGRGLLGPSPRRAPREGGGEEALSVTIHVDQAAGQMQN